jgi:hypothetical protein
MKAVIESTEGLYLIRIYGSGGLCDAYVIDQIELKGEDDEDLRLAMEKV